MGVAVNETFRLCLNDEETSAVMRQCRSTTSQSETISRTEPAARLEGFLKMALENKQVVRVAQFLNSTRDEGVFVEIGTVGGRNSSDINGHNFATRVQFGGKLLDDGTTSRNDC